MKPQSQVLPRKTPGDGMPHRSVSTGRCATSSFTCALGHPVAWLGRGKPAVAGLGAWAGAATQVKEETAQRSGDTKWTPPPVARGFIRSARQRLVFGSRAAKSAMQS